MVLFFATMLLLGTMAVAPNILTEGRREKEAEMIWRGKQYTRGIKLYYRKTGKFPTSLDDLTKPSIGNIRFMRKAYKDPMNVKDGEWRLIYVGPTGQLIGSLNPRRTVQLSGLGSPVGAAPGTPAAQIGAQSSGQPFGQSLGQAAGQVFGNAGGASTASGIGGNANPNAQAGTGSQANPPTGSDGGNSAANGVSADVNDPALDAANQALLETEPSTVIGGKIIGVGSKINQRSIAIFEKAKNYKQFEFIWDPAKDAITIGGAAGPQIGTPAGTIGTPIGQPEGLNGPGQIPNNPNGPLNPQPGPPETTPNQPQQ